MGNRAQALADEFERANRELTATIEQCTLVQWRTTTLDESWPVGVVAHHVAQSHEDILGFIRKRAIGQPLPSLTLDMIHQMNSEHAEQYAHCTRTETLALLRRNAELAARFVRGLSD